MAGLGASLVGGDTLNPVGAGAQPKPEAGDSDDDELVELPDEFARVGAWLSTPKGRPTPLAYAAYAVLVGWPLWFGLIGLEPPMFLRGRRLLQVVWRGRA